MQVDAPAPGSKRHAACAELAFGIDAVGINTRWAACRQHHIRAAHGQQLPRAPRKAQQAAYAVCVRQNMKSKRIIHHRHAARVYAFFQRLGYIAARERPRGGRAAARVVVGLVADIFAHFVCRERHAQLHQLEKGARRAGRLAQRDVAVHIRPAQCARKIAHTVAVIPGKAQLIVGLLVAARIARGAAVHPLGDQQYLLPQRRKAVGRVQPRAAGADHRRSCYDLTHRHRSPFHSFFLLLFSFTFCSTHSLPDLTAFSKKNRRPHPAPARRNNPAGPNSMPAPYWPRHAAVQSAARAAGRRRSSFGIFHARRASYPSR